MTKLSRILVCILMMKLQSFTEGFKNVVIVNNKEMVRNRKGQLVEIKKQSEVNKPKNELIEILEKSNLFKNSEFITNNNFKGSQNNFKSGLITKHNFTRDWFIPTRLSVPIEVTRKPVKVNRSPQTIYGEHFTPQTYMQTTYEDNETPITYGHQTPSFYNDDFSSAQNSLHNIYDEIFKNHFKQYPPVVEKPKPVFSTVAPPMLFKYSTTTSSTFVTNPTKIPIKRKKKKKKKLTTTTTAPTVDNLIKNIDYYRKVLMVNCTKNETKNIELESGTVIVNITPKPSPKPYQSEKIQKSKENLKGDEESHEDKAKKKKKKKCKKHGHGHDHGHDDHDDHDDDHDDDKYSHESESHGYDESDDHKEEAYYAHDHEDDDHDDFFGGFFNYWEDSGYSKDAGDYGKNNDVSIDDESYSESESEYDDNSDHAEKRRKRNTDLVLKKRNPKKSLTTKITVTSEYDDSIPDQTTIKNNQLLDYPTKKPTKIKRPELDSSEEYDDDDDDDEFSFYDNVLGLRDDSSDIEDDSSDEEYYDDIPTNRLPTGEKIKSSVEDYSDEDAAPSSSIFDGVSNLFSTFGSFLSSFRNFGAEDKSRKPPKRRYYDYEDEGRLTTEKVEQQSKRPKRENEPLAWYQPSFLFSNDNDEAFSSTTHRNWMEFPWQPNEDDEIESITTVNPVTIPPVTSSIEETKTSNFFNIFTNFLPSSKNEKLKVKPRVKNRRVNYDDYQLWRLSTKTKEESKVLEDYKISDKGMNVHWMKGPSTRGFTDVVVSPEYVESFKDFLDDNDIQFDVKIRDLQHAVEYENPRLTKRDQIELEVMNGHPLTWYRYHHYRDIHSYLDYLKRKYPEFVELIQVGWSFEGRPLTVVKVSYPYDDSNNISRPFRNFFIKPGIFIQSGLEAHEWLSIASATYILNNLIMNINSNDTLGETIRGADWYVMPVLNPDGYEYSMNYDRLWQKTRSKHSQSSDFWSSLFNWFSTPENRTEECFGVDVNRNFEYNWMKRDASNEICSDFYGGPEHSSEPEVKLLSKFLMEKDKNIEMFISLTGYGQKITFPSDHLSQDKFDEIKDVARAGVKMATKTLPNNELKFSIEGKRKVAGTIDQFAMHKAKIKFSYAIETRDDSYDKFFVQGSSIEKKAKEMFDVIYGMVKALLP